MFLVSQYLKSVAFGACNDLPSAAVMRIASGGAVSASSVNSIGPVQASYATVSADSGAAPYGAAVFSLTQDNIVVGEAGIPASPPPTAARIFVGYRSGIVLAPAQSAAGSIDTATGFALANTGGVSAAFAFTLRALDGAPLAVGHGTLGPGAHTARFIHQLRDIAPDFSLPAGFDMSTGFGSLGVTSNQAVSVLALRMTVNQRQEILLTSTPVAGLASPAPTASLCFPHPADGGGYVTQFILMSAGEAADVTLRLFASTGAPLAILK